MGITDNFNAGDIIYRIEYLTDDIVLEKQLDCAYRVRQYEIIRITKMFLWAKKIDPQIDPARNFPVKYNIKEFFRYGCASTEGKAYSKIGKILVKDMMDKHSSWERASQELNIFYIMYGDKLE